MGWWTRNRLVGIGVAAAVAVAGGAFLVFGDDYGERIEGPFGAYPEAIGDGAPTTLSELITSSNDPWIIDGIGVEIADLDPDDGVRNDAVVAFDVRTGDEYWRYEREDSTPAELAVAYGTVYVLWADELLVGFDLRTAEPRWRTEIDDLGVDRRLLVAGEVVTVVGDDGAVGISAADGGEMWTAPMLGCRLETVLVVGDGIAAETGCESSALVFVFDRDGVQTEVQSSPTARLVHAGQGRFAVTDDSVDARIYSAETGERVAEVPLPSEDFHYYRDGDDERLIAENLRASDDGGPLYAAWDLAEAAPAWTVDGDEAWTAEGRPKLAEERLYSLRREASEGKLWELVVYDAANGEELAATEIDLADYVTVPEHDSNFSYLHDVNLRIWDVGSGTVTVTIDDGSPRGLHGGYCQECSVVFADPG